MVLRYSISSKGALSLPLCLIGCADSMRAIAQIPRVDSLRCSQSRISSRQSYSVRSRSFLQRYSNLTDGVLVLQRHSSCRRTDSGSACRSTIPLSTVRLPLLSSSLSLKVYVLDRVGSGASLLDLQSSIRRNSSKRTRRNFRERRLVKFSSDT